MSSMVAVFRPPRSARLLEPAEATTRTVERRVSIVWGLLVLNVLGWAPGLSILHIPTTIGKLITQGSLQAALIVALTVNRKVIIRPNIFLCLVSLLVIEAIVTFVNAQYFRGTAYRTFRLAEFTFVLWLLTPFWGRRDLLLLRCHLRVMLLVLGSVLLGLMVSPGSARVQGRLVGSIWPIPPPQVAHYAALTLGLVVVLWFCGYRRGWMTLLVVVIAGISLILTHTRTALAGVAAGVLIAGLSLIATKARVRRLFIYTGAVVAFVLITLPDVINTWLARGEDKKQLLSLSGRTNFWGPILAFPRNKFQELFGFGLGPAGFGGLPIDSNWIASYQAQGLFGVAVCAAMLIFLLVDAYFQPRGARRALALFLIGYCLVASFTEVGFTDASTYLLDLTVAASLLMPLVANPGQFDDRAGADGLHNTRT